MSDENMAEDFILKKRKITKEFWTLDVVMPDSSSRLRKEINLQN